MDEAGQVPKQLHDAMYYLSPGPVFKNIPHYNKQNTRNVGISYCF